MKEVKFQCSSWGQGVHLYIGKCLGECLYLNLEQYSIYSNKESSRIRELIKDSKEHPHDALEEAFHENTSLDFGFISSLHFGDTISPMCFHPENELGELMIALCSFSDIKFVLAQREYLDMNNLMAYFDACHEDFVFDVSYEVLSGSWNKIEQHS